MSLAFLNKFIRSPGSIGSVTPSSSALVTSMLATVDWDRADLIVELGAGTGVITETINNLRRSPSVFISFEKDSGMRSALANRYPDIEFSDDAGTLEDVITRKGIGNADYIFSGLPFANFSKTDLERSLNGIYQALKPGGQLIAFQYTRRLRGYLVTTYSSVECSYVARNIPPAFVYRCRK